ncbi:MULTISPECIES: sulfur carrier protein ThiS [Shewanella]|uniref:sulfur carrier protein ThiS n=1 Tax=Shewanella TaxID=22 RepID=UPI001EFCCFFA|nr:MULTISPECIES: sulfur carrier protein ThiS [Shewanella]MCG9721141.1 sulfur carrier protein ThiS [Shewanella sp. Isolate7]MCL2909317.1 sulfur carrier protein ThiS [Shewanella aquimarina]
MNEISISLNGQLIQVPVSTSLEAMLEAQAVALDSIALVRGGEVVPKSTWSEVECQADDVIEIFGVVAGG